MTAGTRISDAPDNGDDRRDMVSPTPGGGAGCPIVLAAAVALLLALLRIGRP